MVRKFGRKNPKEQLGEVRGLAQAASMLDAPISPDSGDMRLVPIDEVRVDPNNPRRLGLDWKAVQADPESIKDQRIRKEVEDIRGLSLTLATAGQRSPCEVVRDGGVFRLVFGERRYWGARLAEMPTLKVIVLHAAPENVPLVQLIENIQHKQLPLYETILNLRSVIAREEELGTPVKDATDLIARTGLARATAYRYWKYMSLPKDVEEALERRSINSHDDLTALLKHETAKARKEALARFVAGGPLEQTANESRSGTRRDKPRAGGRPRTSISFGSTKNGKVAKVLFERLDPDGNYRKMDWNDPTAVTAAWKTLLADLERRIAENG